MVKKNPEISRLFPIIAAKSRSRFWKWLPSRSVWPIFYFHGEVLLRFQTHACVYRRYLAPGSPWAFADNDCLTAGTPRWEKTRRTLSMSFPRRASHRAGPRLARSQRQQNSSAWNVCSIETEHPVSLRLIRFPARWAVMEERPEHLNQSQQEIQHRTVTFQSSSVRMSQRSRMTGTHGPACSSRARSLGIGVSARTRFSCGKTVLSRTQLPVVTWCLMTPKKETLTNPKSRRLSLNVALTRRWWGKKKKIKDEWGPQRWKWAGGNGTKNDSTQKLRGKKNPNLGEVRHATVSAFQTHAYGITTHLLAGPSDINLPFFWWNHHAYQSRAYLTQLSGLLDVCACGHVARLHPGRESGVVAEEPSVVLEEVERLALLLSHESAEIGPVFTSGVLAFSTISTSTLTARL